MHKTSYAMLVIFFKKFNFFIIKFFKDLKRFQNGIIMYNNFQHLYEIIQYVITRT